MQHWLSRRTAPRVENTMFGTWQRIVLRAFTALEPGLKFVSRGMTTWVPAVLLCTGIAFWRITADIETIGPRVICAIACLAAIRATRNAAYFWVAAFSGIALIFNPFVPDMVSRIAIFGLYLVFVATALLGLAVLKFGPRPRASLSLAVQRRVVLDYRQRSRNL
jgi:hypothetical protein